MPYPSHSYRPVPTVEEATAYRLWACPECYSVHLLLYAHRPPYNPTLPSRFQCESCGQSSLGPWSERHPPMRQCNICRSTTPDWRALNARYSEDVRILDSGLAVTSDICFVCKREPNRSPYLSELSWTERLAAGVIGGVDWDPDPDMRVIAENRARQTRGEQSLRQEIQRLTEERDLVLERQRELESSMQDLAQLRTLSPTEFEDSVGFLFAAMGWEVSWTRSSGDHGIDLVINRGKRSAAVQCKRYKRAIGEPAVRQFFGSIAGTFSEGYFVATSAFTEEAKAWAISRKNLHLIEGPAELLSNVVDEPVLRRRPSRAFLRR